MLKQEANFLSSEKYSVESALFLQPPPGKRYVRSFLFSRRIDAPFAQIHLIARTVLVLSISVVQLRTIDTAHPDLIGAIVLWIIACLLFLMSGMNARIARLYFLLTLPALFSLFMTWMIFNPVPGRWTFIQITFFHPLTILVSDRSLLIAITKVIGYSGMVLSTIALVATSRDAELIGALRQLRIPHAITFFLSTVFRALDLALSDYETIRQAQIARALDARPRGFIRRMRDLGKIAVPMVAMMIRRSSEIGDALLARGYHLGHRSADFYETSPWRLIDWFILAFSLVLLSQALIFRLDMTALMLQ
jgi:energy-coupling factor transporter transmembrane protein EcfT